MNRREFITLLSSAAAAWPLAARAQQPAMPVVGFLNGGSPDSYSHVVAAFRRALSEAGYIEGQNVAIEYRWANDQIELLPALAVDLVSHYVAVIATSGSPSALAAKSATSTIPIVFNVTDPVSLGLAVSLSRPGANATGVNVLAGELGPKRLGLLRELVPNAKTVAFLVNPRSPTFALQINQAREAARTLGVQLQDFNAGGQDQIDAAFAAIVQHQADALVVAADPLFNSRRHQLVALAARHAVPAIYEWREFVDAGGLMSYGTSLTDMYRQIGDYTGRILKGAKPSDLPIVQPTKFELVINLKTAKTLGLTVPNAMQLLADEVIE
jgi:putative tryptophan/tyrosine transport system substrate-binding protein